jgi:hypothetical protein
MNIKKSEHDALDTQNAWKDNKVDKVLLDNKRKKDTWSPGAQIGG